MKKKHAFLLGFILIAVVLLWWLGQDKRAPQPFKISSNQDKQEIQHQSEQSSSHQQQIQRSSIQKSPAMSASELEAYGRKAIAEQAIRNEDFEKKWKAQWDTPIRFFGKVIDENKIPVADASVGFKWTDAEGEVLEASTTSDGSGLFSLEGIRGAGLNVHVSKEGYYTSKLLNQTSFLYADLTGRETFTPDSFNPVVFHLRKKGAGAELITSDYGVARSLQVEIPREGSAQIDLLNRRVGPAGQMIVNQTKPAYENWKQAAGWSFRMEIPDGGFIEQNDEFPFEAPERGYEPVMTFKFNREQPKWDRELKKDYYIKFGNPPRYGRLTLETSITMGGARLTYAINPDGSRNLEPSESK